MSASRGMCILQLDGPSAIPEGSFPLPLYMDTVEFAKDATENIEGQCRAGGGANVPSKGVGASATQQSTANMASGPTTVGTVSVQ